MKNKNYTMWALLLVAVVASVAYSALQGGPPTITVTSITAQECGNPGPEQFGCVTVNWTATVPTGTKLNGFKVSVSQQGVANPFVLDNLPASARTAKATVSASPGVPTGTFTAAVTAKFSSTQSAGKTGNF